jgi:hypothetical protein
MSYYSLKVCVIIRVLGLLGIVHCLRYRLIRCKHVNSLRTRCFEKYDTVILSFVYNSGYVGLTWNIAPFLQKIIYPDK